MKRQLALIVAALTCSGAAAGAANASSITLGLDTGEDPANFKAGTPKGDGTLVFGMRRGHFLQRFVARLSADDGRPVTGCLAAGAELVLKTRTGVTLATSGACPAADGLFEMRPVGRRSIQQPTVVQAVLLQPATTEEAPPRPVAAIASNRVVMLVQPNIVNESPKRHDGLGLFPLRIRLGIAPPRATAGTFVVQRKTGSGWTTVLKRAPDRNGRLAVGVTTPYALTVYRVRFLPAEGSGWISIAYELRITQVPR